VEVVKLLHEKMIELKKEFSNTPYAPFFRRPCFCVTVLFVDDETVRRLLIGWSQLHFIFKSKIEIEWNGIDKEMNCAECSKTNGERSNGKRTQRKSEEDRNRHAVGGTSK